MQKKKYRVYELAKEFGKTDKEVIEILKAGHVDVTNRLSVHPRASRRSRKEESGKAPGDAYRPF